MGNSQFDPSRPPLKEKNGIHLRFRCACTGFHAAGHPDQNLTLSNLVARAQRKGGHVGRLSRWHARLCDDPSYGQPGCSLYFSGHMRLAFGSASASPDGLAADIQRSAALRDRANLAGQTQPEISAIHFVRGASDLKAAMPRFVTAFIEAQMGTQQEGHPS
jgi:hypothetical protein